MLLKTIFFVSVLLGLFFSVPGSSFAQTASRKVRQAEKKIERQERIDRRNYEKEKERSLQDHIKRQTPEVQERMKQNRRDNRKMNKPTKAPFYKRWLIKKPD